MGESEDGYLQSQLPYCERADYLIGTTIKVEAYVDESNCCNGVKDFKMCQNQEGCENKLKKLKDVNGKHYSKDVTLTGTRYVVEDENDGSGRRRKLLTGR